MTDSNDVDVEPAFRWIHCPGCSGEIGVPGSYPADVIACPKCAAIVAIDQQIRIRWRPAQNRNGTAPVPGPPDVSPYVKWLECHSCRGEIGIPESWLALSVACPRCGAITPIRNNFRVLWRPPITNRTEMSPCDSSLALDKQVAIPSRGVEGRAVRRVGIKTHLVAVTALLIAMIGINAILTDLSLHELLALVDLAVLISSGLVGIGCWLVIVVEMFDHDRRSLTLFALVALAYALAGFSPIPLLQFVVYSLAVPICYALAFFSYGWIKAPDFGCRRTMVVWSYSLLAAVAAFASVVVSATSAPVMDQPAP